MNDLIIYGAGGFGREVALLVHQANQAAPRWNLRGFVDDNLRKATTVDGIPVLGAGDHLRTYKEKIGVVLAIAEPSVREAIRATITNPVIKFPSLIHPTAQTGHFLNEWSEGCIITAGVIMTLGIKLGSFVIVNLDTTIGHDVQIQDFSTLMPGCSISGNVSLGNRVMVGTGARILQNISIGNSSQIGAGAVVTKSFGAKTKLIGVPARPV